MLKVAHVSKSYEKGRAVIDDINFDVTENNITCLLGRNGAGKSTLIDVICKITRPDFGSVYVNGININANGQDNISNTFGIVSQQDYLINEITGLEYLTFRGLVHKIPKSELEFRIKELTKYFFDETTDINKLISTYSLGNRMKTRIMSALLTDPQILVFDEPFANLDAFSAERLCALISKFVLTPSRCALISSHDLLYVDKIATNILVIDNKKIVFDGTKNDFTRDGLTRIDRSLLDALKTDRVSPNNISWLFKS